MSGQIWVSQTCSHWGYQVKIFEKLMFYMIEFKCPRYEKVRIQKESWYINKSHVHRKLTLDWIFANSNCPICQLIYLFMQNFSLINMQFDILIKIQTLFSSSTMSVFNSLTFLIYLWKSNSSMNKQFQARRQTGQESCVPIFIVCQQSVRSCGPTQHFVRN